MRETQVPFFKLCNSPLTSDFSKFSFTVMISDSDDRITPAFKLNQKIISIIYLRIQSEKKIGKKIAAINHFRTR